MRQAMRAGALATLIASAFFLGSNGAPCGSVTLNAIGTTVYTPTTALGSCKVPMNWKISGASTAITDAYYLVDESSYVPAAALDKVQDFVVLLESELETNGLKFAADNGRLGYGQFSWTAATQMTESCLLKFKSQALCKAASGCWLPDGGYGPSTCDASITPPQRWQPINSAGAALSGNCVGHWKDCINEEGSWIPASPIKPTAPYQPTNDFKSTINTGTSTVSAVPAAFKVFVTDRPHISVAALKSTVAKQSAIGDSMLDFYNKVIAEALKTGGTNRDSGRPTSAFFFVLVGGEQNQGVYSVNAAVEAIKELHKAAATDVELKFIAIGLAAPAKISEATLLDIADGDPSAVFRAKSIATLNAAFAKQVITPNLLSNEACLTNTKISFRVPSAATFSDFYTAGFNATDSADMVGNKITLDLTTFDGNTRTLFYNLDFCDCRRAQATAYPAYSALTFSGPPLSTSTGPDFTGLTAPPIVVEAARGCVGAQVVLSVKNTPWTNPATKADVLANEVITYRVRVLNTGVLPFRVTPATAPNAETANTVKITSINGASDKIICPIIDNTDYLDCILTHPIANGEADDDEVVMKVCIIGANISGSGLLVGGSGPAAICSNEITLALPAAAASFVVAPTYKNTLARPLAGTKFDYIYTVSNSGNAILDLTGAFTSTAAPTPSAPAVVCPNNGLVLPKGKITCKQTHTFTQAQINAGTLTNDVQLAPLIVGSDPPAYLTVTPVTNDHVKDVTPLPVPLLGMVGSTVKGTNTNVKADTTEQTATVTLKNLGNVDLSITAVAKSGTTTGNFVCAPTTLAPGASTVCTIKNKPAQTQVDAGIWEVTAQVTATTTAGTPLTVCTTGAFDATNSPKSICNLKVGYTWPLAGKMAISVDSTPKTGLSAAETITYRVTVRNIGFTTLNTLTVASSGLTFMCDPATACAPGQSAVCTSSTVEVSAAQITAQSIASKTFSASALVGSSTTIKAAATSTTYIAPVNAASLTVVNTFEEQNLGKFVVGSTYNGIVTVTNAELTGGAVSLTNVVVIVKLGTLEAVVTCPTEVATLDNPEVIRTCTYTVTLAAEALNIAPTQWITTAVVKATVGTVAGVTVGTAASAPFTGVDRSITVVNALEAKGNTLKATYKGVAYITYTGSQALYNAKVLVQVGVAVNAVSVTCDTLSSLADSSTTASKFVCPYTVTSSDFTDASTVSPWQSKLFITAHTAANTLDASKVTLIDAQVSELTTTTMEIENTFDAKDPLNLAPDAEYTGEAVITYTGNAILSTLVVTAKLGTGAAPSTAACTAAPSNLASGVLIPTPGTPTVLTCAYTIILVDVHHNAVIAAATSAWVTDITVTALVNGLPSATIATTGISTSEAKDPVSRATSVVNTFEARDLGRLFEGAVYKGSLEVTYTGDVTLYKLAVVVTLGSVERDIIDDCEGITLDNSGALEASAAPATFTCPYEFALTTAQAALDHDQFKTVAIIKAAPTSGGTVDTIGASATGTLTSIPATAVDRSMTVTNVLEAFTDAKKTVANNMNYQGTLQVQYTGTSTLYDLQMTVQLGGVDTTIDCTPVAAYSSLVTGGTLVPNTAAPPTFICPYTITLTTPHVDVDGAVAAAAAATPQAWVLADIKAVITAKRTKGDADADIITIKAVIGTTPTSTVSVDNTIALRDEEKLTVGDEYPGSVTVKNTGNMIIYGLGMTVQLAAGSESSITCTNDSMFDNYVTYGFPPGASYTCDYIYTLAQADTAVTLSNWISTVAVKGKPNILDVSHIVAATGTSPVPALSVVNTFAALAAEAEGTVYAGSVTVTNQGNTVVYGLAMEMKLGTPDANDAADYSSPHPIITCTNGGLFDNYVSTGFPPGASYTCDYTYAIRAAPSTLTAANWISTVTVKGSDVPGGGAIAITSDASPPPTLSVVNTIAPWDSNKLLEASEHAGSVTVTNTGNAVLYKLAMKMKLGTTTSADYDTPWQISTCTNGGLLDSYVAQGLPPGASYTCDFVYAIRADPSVLNAADWISTVSVWGTYVSTGTAAEIASDASPTTSLSAINTFDPYPWDSTKLESGDIHEGSVTVTNTGNTKVYKLGLKMKLGDTGADFTSSGAVTCADSQALNDVGTAGLAPGASYTCAYTYAIRAAPSTLTAANWISTISVEGTADSQGTAAELTTDASSNVEVVNTIDARATDFATGQVVITNDNEIVIYKLLVQAKISDSASVTINLGSCTFATPNSYFAGGFQVGGTCTCTYSIPMAGVAAPAANAWASRVTVSGSETEFGTVAVIGSDDSSALT